MADQPDNHEESWIDATNAFIGAASDLGPLYSPQIKALRTLAERLDMPGESSAALVAEYSRVHRWLLNKIGGARGGADDGPSLADMLPGLDLFG